MSDKHGNLGQQTIQAYWRPFTLGDARQHPDNISGLCCGNGGDEGGFSVGGSVLIMSEQTIGSTRRKFCRSRHSFL